MPRPGSQSYWTGRGEPAATLVIANYPDVPALLRAAGQAIEDARA
jgi:hypothetical protein